MTRKLLFLFAYIAFINLSSAQYQMGLVPRSSPDMKIYQKIGFTEIEITYGSPKVNDREIWGELVPYNQVWRAGANKATTISLGTNIEINGQILKAGTYSFFVVPNETNSWVGIFNKVAEQWGAFKYNQEEDALRIPLKVSDREEDEESLVYNIFSADVNEGGVRLEWENKSMEFKFTIDYIENFVLLIQEKAIDTDKNIKWVLYLQAAEHLVNQGENSPLIIEWLDKSKFYQDSIEDWNEQFYPIAYVEAHRKYTRARHFQQQGRTKEAVALLQSLEKEEYQLFYSRNSEEINEGIKNWKN